MTALRPRFDGLVPKDHRTYDPLDIMRDLRGGIENLPDTAATFKLDSVLDDHPPNAVSGPMVVLVDSWEVPDYYKDGGKQRVFVNPQYHDLVRYAGAFSRCQCGALLVRDRQTRGETVLDREHDHTDNCKRSWRLKARAELLERRESVLEELLLHAKSFRSMSARLGYTTGGSGGSSGHLTEAQRMPSERLKRRGERKRVNTEAAAVAAGADLESVGRLWGVTGGTIRWRINTKTDRGVESLRSEGAA